MGFGKHFFGTSTLGPKGQVVIPAEARKQLKLKTGDKFLVMDGRGDALVFISPDQTRKIIERLRGHAEAMQKVVKESERE